MSGWDDDVRRADKEDEMLACGCGALIVIAFVALIVWEVIR